MDGVLADTQSSWVFVHEHFGVNNEHSLRAYLRGEIDDLEFIRRDIQLWKAKSADITENDVKKVLAGVPLMPGAAKTIRSLKDSGIKTAIVSAGIDLLAERIAKELGIDRHLANGLKTGSGGELTGYGVLRVRLMDKGDAVTDLVSSLGLSRRDTISVGNSKYDVTMFRRSWKGIAFMPTDETVRKSADAVVEEKNLTSILDFV